MDGVTSRDDVGPILNGIPTHLPDIDPAEMAALVEEVTRTDVTDIAAGIVCDCVYLLKGTEAAADDK